MFQWLIEFLIPELRGFRKWRKLMARTAQELVDLVRSLNAKATTATTALGDLQSSAATIETAVEGLFDIIKGLEGQVSDEIFAQVEAAANEVHATLDAHIGQLGTAKTQVEEIGVDSANP
jgi:hypothetical protein